MEYFFCKAYYSINIGFAIICAVFSLLFLVLSVPDDRRLRDYRTCRKILAVAYFVFAFFSFIEFLNERRSILPDQRITLCMTLIVASFETLFMPVSLVTIVNTDYLDRRRLGLELIPISLLSALLLVGLFLPLPTAAIEASFIIFGLYFTTQLIRAFLLLARQSHWARERLDNYFSGREEEHIAWVRRIGCVSIASGPLILLAELFPSWFLSFFVAVFSALAFTYVAIRYLNYVVVFQLLRPALASAEDGKRYQSSKLAGLDVDHLLAELENLMERERLYADESLNIAQLSERLGVTSHQLSELINAKLGVNFRAYVNSLRVEEAKRLLVELPEESVFDLALECGFSTKSTFHAAFSKSTGVTPTEWRRGQRRD